MRLRLGPYIATDRDKDSPDNRGENSHKTAESVHAAEIERGSTMAANAKIGLLLGLVSVFVLAFALNSVHCSGDRKGNNDLAPIVVEGPPGIRPAISPEALPSEPVSQGPAIQTPAAGTQDRYRAVLPEIAATEGNSTATQPAKPPSTRSAPLGPARAGVPSASEGPAAAPPVVRYVVCEGDSLAYIARKFYGPQQGNKRENVMKIFEANRGVLKSPDQIDVGQELVIPPLEAPQPQKKPDPTILPDSMFEKVESIGRKRL